MQTIQTIAWVSLCLAVLCAMLIAIDLLGRPQHMWIMNLVWVLTGLYAGPIGLIGYFLVGRMPQRQGELATHAHSMEHMKEKSMPVSVGLGATHCGAGCALGDLVAESLIVLVPVLGMYPFHTRMFNAWIVDFILAYLFGIAFQYFTIAPMRHLSLAKGIVAAIKADTLSLTAWQIGMYGWMAIAMFVIFRREIPATQPLFWFMMQIAMLCGFATSYPVNWWLIRAGLKEKM